MGAVKEIRPMFNAPKQLARNLTSSSRVIYNILKIKDAIYNAVGMKLSSLQLVQLLSKPFLRMGKTT